MSISTNLLTKFSAELLSSIIRTLTGKLYTDDQIKTITSGAIGKYFSDLFPIPKDETAAQERVEAARNHISAASSIINDMQKNLETQDRKLGELLIEIEQKKKLADRYQSLAQTNKEAFEAFRVEMIIALKNELQEQADKGKTFRQFASVFLWVVTLVAGAALGTYFPTILKWCTGSP